ncbi:competence protein ComK [Psychrobacillus soli]|uniref:Competence protein n=1 Tax=Psychrobacillus soli TaxID=1543965 RepID=A0A544SY79_9BACI|nr:competence protein ComK [Psychrobacillus soli]TQR10153.1 hypothetical protein FG383_15320 [Psychrobacillus soli]
MKEKDSKLINRRVLALESVFTNGNKSKITTTNGIHYSKMSVLELLNNACMRYASTLEGRMKAIKLIMNYYHKTPILINPKEFGAFPTVSYKDTECVWIFNHHFYVNELGNGKSQIVFDNGIHMTVKVSKNVLLKQQQRLHTAINIISNIEDSE